ncbi:MAG: helix-turn-helix transcriptional regulator [Eubacteriales bacterium]|nr:helix-turn-helix transcriptional regulator [Eubacteriales bacterium]
MRLILANMRENTNLTQDEISRCANISQGYYSDIESGIRCPSPDVATRIAKVLDIPEQDMFRVFYSEEHTRYKRI